LYACARLLRVVMEKRRMNVAQFLVFKIYIFLNIFSFEIVGMYLTFLETKNLIFLS
jgi:hypothetical protein